MTTHNLNDTLAFIKRHNPELTRKQIRGFLFDMAKGTLDGMRVSTANENLAVTFATASETGPWFEIRTARPEADEITDAREDQEAVYGGEG
jgi:hypothetical protein